MVQVYVSRRNFTSGLLGLGALSLPGVALAVLDPKLKHGVATLPIESFSPESPYERYVNDMQPYAFDSELWGYVVGRLWRHFELTKAIWAGEWAMGHLFVQWRNYDNNDSRIKLARIGQKMSLKFKSIYPEHVGGYFWHAMHVGLEGLARGPLNALNMVPRYMADLTEANERDPNYYYAMGTLGIAKMYLKLPSPPVSLGNPESGFDYLERCRAAQEGHFAQWHLTKAEALIQKGDKQAAIREIDTIRTTVKPRNGIEGYIYDVTLHDAQLMKARLLDGTYSKYWDPLLERAQSGL